jgi:hypothetical protein
LQAGTGGFLAREYELRSMTLHILPDAAAQLKPRPISVEDAFLDATEMTKYLQSALADISSGKVPIHKVRNHASRTLRYAPMFLTLNKA